jgi:glycosyltransferase involved in cell wall biosynthesis
MDLYARKLAENLDVPKFYSDIYQRVAKLFHIPLFCQAAMKAPWYDWCFVRALNRTNSIVHLPNHHLGRYGLFLRVPYIITVHDLIRYFDLKGYGTYIHRPNLRDRVYLSLDYKGVKKAIRVIAVSHTTKNDLVRHLGIPEERIAVIYEGIDHRVFRPTSHRIMDHPYLLFVGSEQPRKNFIGLLQAFRRLKGERKFKDLKLVKVGKAGGWQEEFRKQTLRAITELDLAEEVIFTEYVPEGDLPAYYSGAECFVLPSFYEGFGFPPLEAMACGCPVITSDAPSLVEITGEAAIHVNRRDGDSLARAIRQVLTEESLRKDLVRRGLLQAQRFSWERTARQTMEVYRQVDPGLAWEAVPEAFPQRAPVLIEQAPVPVSKHPSEMR